MARLLVQQSVKDFSVWKEGFMKGAELRSSFGARSEQIFQDSSMPEKVTVLLELDSLEQARRFAESHELKEAMEKSGVVGTPSLSFLKEV